jgi:hypothetical protein
VQRRVGEHLDATLRLGTGPAARRVRLADYLDAEGSERAAQDANAWIKRIRLARVDGTSFRERFTYRGDSLWWFAELYLHKERAVLSIFQTMHAAAALFNRESPAALGFESGSEVARLLLPQMARARGIPHDGPATPTAGRRRLWRMDARSTALMIAAVASRSRPRRGTRDRRATVAAFIHRAFWRGDAGDGSAESYIGPVLHALETRLSPGAVQYIGVGPTTNFRARRWWRTVPVTQEAVRPIETLAPRDALAGSSGLWAARHAMRRAMTASRDLREASRIAGCDCWPIVEDALAGVALLQFPWSARAMDEAAAAFEALQPSVALTYAEAGGWGRALALEARRRSIPLAGLQHGFIYRHWLNYLHEPDEMAPAGPDGSDKGFPLPVRTLVFDHYAARHLAEVGRFPPEAISITGSPRLEALAARFGRLTEDEVGLARAAAGAADDRPLVLLATKYSEIRPVLPALLEAIKGMPGAQLAVKTHPAETPPPYERAAAGIPNVRVLPAACDLAPLLRASRVVVTVNSTVALDAMALGVPALSIDLPNNLSPFVEAGAMAGAARGDEIGPVLERILYDQGFRQRLSAIAASLVTTYGMAPASSAAERSASAVTALMPPDTQE